MSALWRFVQYWSLRVRRSSPIRLVLVGYVSYIAIGWLLLMLPVSRNPGAGNWLDHLFTATSAVSTTGLVTIATGDGYTAFGEVVVLLLIQLGGLGYMTIGSFLLLSASGSLSPLRQRIATTTLVLPDSFNVASFLRVMVSFTLLTEVAGAIFLYPVFREHGAPHPVWQAVFHSISAFCTAGFGLFSDSFEGYRGDVRLNLVVTVLSFLGAIGFIVIHDLWHSLRRRKPHVTLTSRIILLSTAWIFGLGTLLFGLEEPTVRALPFAQRWIAAAFQVMSASTTVGFNTIPIGALSSSSVLLLIVLMMIGASPAGTGGGIKTTTVTALWAEMVAMIRRRDATTFLGREIPRPRLRMASAGMMFYCLTLAAGVYALSLVETAPLPDQLFECASALGTVGLSRGLTGSLSAAGKWIIILLMFAGRVGPHMAGMAFFVRRPRPGAAKAPSEDVAI